MGAEPGADAEQERDHIEPAPVAYYRDIFKDLIMHCETLLDSGAHHSICCDVESRIAFEDIKADDKVLIKTTNSEYRFSVTDPSSHKGMLSGGKLGEVPKEAFLIESLVRDENGGLRDFRGLKTGARALFYLSGLSSARSIERVTTSKISGLTLVKAADRDSLIS